MEDKNISIKKAFSFGWEKLKEKFVFLITLVAIIWFASIIPSIVIEKIKDGFPTTSNLLLIFSAIISIILNIGIMKISINFADKKTSKIKDLVSSYELFFKYLGTLIIYWLIILGGLILFIVPGIIWAIKFQFFGFELIDKNLKPIDALKRSSKITKGHKLKLFVFNLLSGSINLLGVAMFGLGIFITIPITSLALGYIFRKLSPQKTKNKQK
ncbi:MAG: hypothetical protein WDZ80_00735 [Candidatus Paceibacterota bacterium]